MSHNHFLFDGDDDDDNNGKESQPETGDYDLGDDIGERIGEHKTEDDVDQL